MPDQVLFHLEPTDFLDPVAGLTVMIDGVKFNSADQAYQYHKFLGANDYVCKMILNAGSAYEAKEIAAGCAHHKRKDWADVKRKTMKRILHELVKQHYFLWKILLKTDGEIICNSKTDSFWGIGADGKGRNEIGKIYMEIKAVEEWLESCRSGRQLERLIGSENIGCLDRPPRW